MPGRRTRFRLATLPRRSGLAPGTLFSADLSAHMPSRRQLPSLRPPTSTPQRWSGWCAPHGREVHRDDPDDHAASRRPFEIELQDFGADPSLCRKIGNETYCYW